MAEKGDTARDIEKSLKDSGADKAVREGAAIIRRAKRNGRTDGGAINKP